MVQAQTAEQEDGGRTAKVNPNDMPLPEPSIYGKIENVLGWLNEPSEGKYTIGAAIRKMFFMEPSEHGLHLSRIGRLTERAVTITGVVLACAMGPGNIGFFALLLAAKVAGAGAGGLIAMPLSKGLEGTFRKLNAHFGQKKSDTDDFARKRGLIGGSEVDSGPAGVRNAHEIKQEAEHKIGASRTINPDASIKEEFDQKAARAFDPNGPKPLEAYGLGTAQKKTAAGPGQKNG